MSRFAVFVIAVVLATVPVLSACGGSDEPSGPSKSELAQNAFLTKVNQVCLATNQVTDSVQPKKLSQVPAAAEQLVPAQRAQIVSMRQLTPPAELKVAWENMLQALQKQVTLLDQIRVAAKHGATVGEVTKLVKLLNAVTIEGQQRAGAMRLANCGT